MPKIGKTNKEINKEAVEKKAQKKFTAPNGSLSHILSERKDIQDKDFKPKIAVIGVGGAGGNTIDNLVRSNLDNVITITCNTDAQALEKSLANIKLQLGPKYTMGHGAGANAEVGKQAALESEDEIRKLLEGVHMAFVVAGLGGGTGTGAGPEICRIALEMGILTLGFVTTPFNFEGAKRKLSADHGLDAFQDNCDVLIVVMNQNLFSLTNEETTFLSAFAMTDDVLSSGVKSVVNTISEAGLINTDLADFFSIMKGRKSRARMGTGVAEGEDRGMQAAQEAMASPLLELGGLMAKDIDNIIICIRCGRDMTLNDINQAVDYVKQSISTEANIIFGATIDDAMIGKAQVSIFATSSIMNKDNNIEEETHEQALYEPTSIEIKSFEELIADDIELGRAHHDTLHEDNLNNEKEFLINQEKPNIFKRFFKLFTKRKKDLPPYFKKKD
jgi:cell division protein FtsZ